MNEDDTKDDANKDGWLSISGIQLTQEDKKVLLEGGWLNDKHIHSAQILRKQDTDLLPVGSLQNPLLGQNLRFEVVTQESVQILHSGGNHWLTISTVGLQNSTVKVYDSLGSRLPCSTVLQITSLLHSTEDSITILYACD